MLFSADRYLTHAHQPLEIAFTKQFQLSKCTKCVPTFSRKFCDNCSVSKTKFLQCLDPTFIFLRYLPITKVISRTAIMTWNIEEFRAYYNAMLHVNIKIMTSQQRLLVIVAQVAYNKCESRSWSLRFRQFDIMSSKYSTKQYISALYCAKQMSKIWCKNIQAFLRYSNFRVPIFSFASPCVSRSAYGALRSFMVIQGRRNWYQSKAHMTRPISLPL